MAEGRFRYMRMVLVVGTTAEDGDEMQELADLISGAAEQLAKDTVKVWSAERGHTGDAACQLADFPYDAEALDNTAEMLEAAMEEGD